jgi:hypothetical protein
MPPIRVAAERAIAAPPEVVYGVVANYRDGHHQAILPPAFSAVEVVAGGVGAGTMVRFSLRLGGRTRRVEARLDEPEPGRLLTEIVPTTDTVTRFVVDPAPGGSRVRIETLQPPSPGPAGWVERLLVPRLLGPLYADELARLDRYARDLAAKGRAGAPARD